MKSSASEQGTFLCWLSLCELMTNYSIVFTITCQGEWVVQMVLLERDSWPDWRHRVQRWDWVIGQKWIPAEMFTWDLHYVNPNISARCFWTACDDCFDQLLFTSNRCGRVLLRPASTEEMLNALSTSSFCGIDSKKTCVQVVCRLHTNSSTHIEAHPSCKG